MMLYMLNGNSDEHLNFRHMVLKKHVFLLQKKEPNEYLPTCAGSSTNDISVMFFRTKNCNQTKTV